MADHHPQEDKAKRQARADMKKLVKKHGAKKVAAHSPNAKTGKRPGVQLFRSIHKLVVGPHRHD